MPKKISWSSLLAAVSLSAPENFFTLDARPGWRESWTEVWGTPWRGEPDHRARPPLEAGPAASADLARTMTRLPAASVIALVGLAFEARIVAGPGVLVICRGKCPIADIMPGAVRNGCRGMISFGVAGGLSPALEAGDCVVASAVIDATGSHPTDPTWSRKLLDTIPAAHHAPILGVNAIVPDPAAKRRLRAATGAAAVDMESHLVARLATAHGLAFAAVRVIVDPADRAVPPAARVAMATDGSTDLASMLWEIAARPSQLAALLRIAADAYVARSALARLRQVLVLVPEVHSQ